jgi:hypothetical protein
MTYEQALVVYAEMLQSIPMARAAVPMEIKANEKEFVILECVERYWDLTIGAETQKQPDSYVSIWYHGEVISTVGSMSKWDALQSFVLLDWGL